jgi:hypothetical protein
MAANERDSTGEWLLPVGGGPPTLYELEQRVEVALTVARAAETAALEIGAASLDAARQAHRAAELAEKASLAAAARAPAPAPNGNGHPAPPPPEPEPAPDYRLDGFMDRADKLAARLSGVISAAGAPADASRN